MKMYQELLVYKNKYKSTFVPRSKDGNRSPLSNWVSSQRTTHKNNMMLKERYDLLDSIDLVWDARTHTSNNNNDDDNNDDAVDDEKKPAVVVYTRPLKQERGIDVDHFTITSCFSLSKFISYSFHPLYFQLNTQLDQQRNINTTVCTMLL